MKEYKDNDSFSSITELIEEVIPEMTKNLIGEYINTHRKYTPRHGRRIKHKYEYVKPGIIFYVPGGRRFLKRLLKRAN